MESKLQHEIKRKISPINMFGFKAQTAIDSKVRREGLMSSYQ